MNEQEQHNTQNQTGKEAVHVEHSTQEQTTEEQSKLAACTHELADLKERYIRTVADFENYKRRAEKEKSRWIVTGQEMILSDILTIVDNFDRAFKDQEEVGASQADAWLAGFKMIYKELQKIFAHHEVTEITDTVFDPNLHEALMQVESADHESGAIVEVLEKGYRFKDTVLRPAKVSVAK